MIYTKPSHLKYTDLAIFIDKHISEIVNDGEYPELEKTIFHYLYSICYVLACKGKLFTKFEDYDGFAIYAASQMYIIMRNRITHQGEIRRDKEIKPIKSCLNYIKHTLYPFKVNYQKANFRDIINPDVVDFDSNMLADNIKNGVRDTNFKTMNFMILDSFNELPNIIKQVVNETPYAKNTIMYKNIYISCLLSFINNVTLPNHIDKDTKNYDSLCRYYVKSSYQKPILWHLDADMSDYIKLLLNKIKHRLSIDLQETKSQFDLDDNVVDSIVASAYEEYNSINNENNNNEDN